jgi:hypothetical protein
MEIEIKENKIADESAEEFATLIINILRFIEGYVIETGTQIPESGKILVYINTISHVHFTFQGIPPPIEIRFRHALGQFYRM